MNTCSGSLLASAGCVLVPLADWLFFDFSRFSVWFFIVVLIIKGTRTQPAEARSEPEHVFIFIFFRSIFRSAKRGGGFAALLRGGYVYKIWFCIVLWLILHRFLQHSVALKAWKVMWCMWSFAGTTVSRTQPAEARSEPEHVTVHRFPIESSSRRPRWRVSLLCSAVDIYVCIYIYTCIHVI